MEQGMNIRAAVHMIRMAPIEHVLKCVKSLEQLALLKSFHIHVEYVISVWERINYYWMQ